MAPNSRHDILSVILPCVGGVYQSPSRESWLRWTGALYCRIVQGILRCASHFVLVFRTRADHAILRKKFGEERDERAQRVP
ncbi:hypothetical protein JAAARDRAFT_706434, partial [Jaapia argillacea MUCL 33604]